MKHAFLRARVAIGLGAALLLSTALVGDVSAQAPPVEIGKSGRTNYGATPGALSPLMTLTAVGPSTVNSPPQTGTGKNLTCVLDVTAITGTPANVLSIQGQVPGTTSYFTIISTSSVATVSVTPLSVGPQMTAASNAVAATVLPAVWRAQVVLGTGTTPTTTGAVICTSSD